MRNTFHGIVASSGRFLDASLLAILYIVPYAVWGQNLFGGLLYSCNDSGAGISSRVDCVGEFAASPSQWTFLAPRVWQNPTEGSQYSFDDFRSALLILFEVVSLEGWISVMTAAMAIVGRDMQSSPDATQVNALFFVIYNLIGAVCESPLRVHLHVVVLATRVYCPVCTLYTGCTPGYTGQYTPVPRTTKYR